VGSSRGVGKTKRAKGGAERQLSSATANASAAERETAGWGLARAREPVVPFIGDVPVFEWVTRDEEGTRTHARARKTATDGPHGQGPAWRGGNATRGGVGFKASRCEHYLGMRGLGARGSARARTPRRAGATRGAGRAESPRSRAPVAVWTPVNARLTARFSKNLNRSAL
jgi:hypothetical protein